MLPKREDYAALRRDFVWQVPPRFNLASACGTSAGRAEKVAIIEAREGEARHVTFGEIERKAAQIANVLKAKGLKRGERLAILLPQMPETALTHLAAWRLGAVTVPLAMLFGPDALKYRLADSGASGLVTLSSCLDKIAEHRDALADLRFVLTVDGPGEGAEDLSALMERASERGEIAGTGPDDPAVMVYTSGTTGPPKGALHGHRVLIGHLPGVEFCHEFLPQTGDLLWTPADWAWAGGLFNILLPALYFGIPVVANRAQRFDPEAALTLMARHGVRNAFIPPTALKMLRAVPDPSRYGVKLRTLGSGGESLGREAHEWGRSAFGLSINEFYGQTECNYVLSSCGALGVFAAGAIGKAVPGHEVAIIDREGNVLPAGEQGQIAVRAPDPVMFLQYWGRPEATREKYVGDWLTTGDQGVMDEEGYVSFVGRDDDVITSAGFRIGPGEIEDCLIGHPAVQLAAAVGKPDLVRTEIVKAYVVLAEGFEPSAELAEEIGRFVRERLSAHEYPREVAFVQEMPLTTTGKVIRRHFRDEARREAEGE